MKNSYLVIAGVVLIAAGIIGYLSTRPAAPEVPPPAPVIPPPPPGPPPPPLHHHWTGFPVGSWAVIEKTLVKDGVATTSREKITLVELSPEGPILNVRAGKGDSFESPGTNVAAAPGALLESQAYWKAGTPRTGTLEVAGKPLECVLTEYAHENPQANVANKVVAWRSATIKVPYRQLPRNGPDVALPPDLLRLDFKVRAGAQHQTYDLRVLQLDAPIAVAGREIPCVLEESTVDEVRPGFASKGSFKRWLSADVPGRVVRAESAGVTNGAPVSRSEVVVDFGIPR